MPSRKASWPAVLNDSSFESTSWYEPSKSVDLEVDHRVAGQEAALPGFLQPFSTAGMNCRGIEPPKMSSTNSKPPPRGSGSKRILQSPNWPWPPVCFLWRPWASTAAVIVSR